MPQIVELPGGRTAEFPDGMGRDEIRDVLRRRDRKERLTAQLEAERANSPSGELPPALDQLERFRRSMESSAGQTVAGISRAPGAIGRGVGRVMSTALRKVGAEDLAEGLDKAMTNEPLWGDKLLSERGVELGEAMQEHAKRIETNPEADKEFLSKVVAGAGSLPPILAGGGGAGSAIAAAGMLGESGLEDLKQEAERTGIEFTDAEADTVFALNAGLGLASEALLGVPALLRSAKAAGIKPKTAGQLIRSILVQGAKGYGREGTQEALEQIGQNVIAGDVVKYDPEREATQGAVESFLVGGMIGGPFSAGVQALSEADGIIRRRRREGEIVRPATQEEIDALPVAKQLPFEGETTSQTFGPEPGTIETVEEEQGPSQVVDVPVVQVPIKEMAVRPDLMQFKRIDDGGTGVNDADRLEGDWDDKKAGVLLLWEPADAKAHGLKAGERYIVANGHHRMEFARRAGREGLNAQIVREADGVSAEEARRLGAEINIADGKGTIHDQAKFIRNTAATHGADAALATARSIGARGRKAATIGISASDSVYESFINERISGEQAEAIAAAAPGNEALQRVGLTAATGGMTPAALGNYMQAVGLEAGPAAEQGSLFGDDDSALERAREMAEAAASLRRQLDEQIKATDNAAKRAGQAQAQGIKFDRDPAEILAENARLKAERARWNQWASHPDLVARVREELGGLALPETPDGTKVAPPKGANPRLKKLLKKRAEGKKLTKKEQAELDELERAEGQGMLTEIDDSTAPPAEPEQGMLMAPEKSLAPMRMIEAPNLESGDPVSVADIRRYLSAALDIPIRLGVGRVRALGFFRPVTETIRMKRINDLPVIAHEVGHYLHYILFPGRRSQMGYGITSEGADAFANRFDDELMELGKVTSRPSYTPHQVRKEGVAEWFREWLTDRSEALAKAPKFTAFFEERVEQDFPEVWKIVQRAREDVRRYVTQGAKSRVMSMIDMRTARPGAAVSDVLKKLYTSWVDELAPLTWAMRRLERSGLNPRIARRVVEFATNYRGGWRGKVEHSMLQRQLDYDGNDIGESFREILKGVESMDDFRAYLVARRAVELQGRWKDTGISREDARAVVKELGPKYESRAKRLTAFLHQELDMLAAAGLVTPAEVRQMQKMNAAYVPFHRVYEGLDLKSGGGKAGFIDVPKRLKKFTGDTRQIADPLESIVKNLYVFRDMVERNRVGRSFVDAVQSVRGGGRVAEEVARKIEPVQVSDAEARAFLAQMLDVAESELPGSASEVMQLFDKEMGELGDMDLSFRVWRAGRTQSARDGIFSVWKDGKQEFYQMDDPALYQAMQMSDAANAGMNNVLIRLLKPFTKVFRAGATLTPEFMSRNIFRDQVTAGVYSKYGFVPFVDGFRGMLSALKRDDLYWRWVKNGGRYADFVAMDRADLQKTLADVTNEHTAAAMMKRWGNPIRTLQRMSELMEQASRIGEYRRAEAHGADAVTAANASKDITLNFSRFGVLGKAVNQVVAFFNAGIQDIDKFARAHKERPVQTTMKGLMYITAPSILFWWLGKDDDEIQNLPEWRKNFFWNVNLKPIGRMLGRPDGDFVFSIPKPFLLGQVYGSSVERALDAVYKDDPNAAAKWFNSVWQSTPFTAETMMPTAAKPFVENWANRSFFREGPIEGMALQRLPEIDRSTPTTSAVAKQIARLANILSDDHLQWSPVKIDNVIHGLGAGLGRIGTDAIDHAMMATRVGDIPEEPAKDLFEMPGFRAFSGSPYEASADVERFYKAMTMAEERVAAFRGRALGEINSDNRRFFQRNRQELAWYLAPNGDATTMTQIRRGRDQLSEITKAIREVQRSTSMSRDTKRERLLALSQMRDDTASGLLKLMAPKDRERVR